MAAIKERGGESANIQTGTLKDSQETLDIFILDIVDIVKNTIQEWKLEYFKDLLAGKNEEIIQPNVILENEEEAVRGKMESSILETEVLVEASTQSVGEYQKDLLLQTAKYYENFCFYGQSQFLENEVIDFKSRKSGNWGFKVKEITLKADWTLKRHQLQFQLQNSLEIRAGGRIMLQKFSKIKAGGRAMLKKKVSSKKKDWKKYRKKGRKCDEFFEGRTW